MIITYKHCVSDTRLTLQSPRICIIYFIAMLCLRSTTVTAQSSKQVQANNKEILADIFNDTEQADYLFIGIDAKPRTTRGKAREITLVNRRLKGDTTGQYSTSYINDSTVWYMNSEGKDTASIHYSLGTYYKKLTHEYQDGRTLKEIQYTNNGRNIHTTSFYYQPDGRLLRKEITMTNLQQAIEIRYDNTPASIYEYRVENNGQPIPMSRTETDKMNNILRRMRYSFEGRLTRSSAMQYDESSRLTGITDSVFTKSFQAGDGYQDTMITIRRFEYEKDRLLKQTQQNEIINWERKEIPATPPPVSQERNVDVVMEQPEKKYRYVRSHTDEKQPVYTTYYTYNQQGQETSRLYTHGKTEFVYTYDTNGNWTSLLIIIDKIPAHLLIRNISYRVISQLKASD